MLKDTDYVEVQNLADHKVVFVDGDNHRRVVFQPQETKKISVEMLNALNFRYGGSVLLQNYLSVKDKDLARSFGVSDDTIEYNWTKTDVDNLLKTGSMDALLDALEFGPDAIKELIASRAVDLKINSVDKRKAITEYTGRDIDAQIKNKEDYEKSLPEVATHAPSRRRVKNASQNSETQTVSSGRRVASANEGK